MDTIFLGTSAIFFLIFFSTGIYVFRQIQNKKFLAFYGIALIVASLYVYGLVRSYSLISVKQYIFWTKYFTLVNEFGTTIWLLGTYFLQKEFNKNKIKILTIAFVLANIILLYFLLFTNVLISYDTIDLSQLETLKNTMIPVTGAYIIRILFTFMKCIFISFIVVQLLRDPEVVANKDRTNSLKVLFISFVLIAAGVIWGIVYPFMWTYYEIFIRGSGIILFAYSVFNYDLLIEQKKAIQKEFFLELLYMIILSLIYHLIFAILFARYIFNLNFFGDFIVISGAVILTHSYYEKVKETISFLFRYKRVYVPNILLSDVTYGLKGLYSPHLLEKSRLLKLQKVEKLSERERITRNEALKKVIFNSINTFKPRDNGKKRTLPRLKYEILYMLAHEDATESQIMWDLGFDAYTRSVSEKISTAEKNVQPRFPIRGESDYSATSARSFKRLKKEAIEMLRWKLEYDLIPS